MISAVPSRDPGGGLSLKGAARVLANTLPHSYNLFIHHIDSMP